MSAGSHWNLPRSHWNHLKLQDPSVSFRHKHSRTHSAASQRTEPSPESPEPLNFFRTPPEPSEYLKLNSHNPQNLKMPLKLQNPQNTQNPQNFLECAGPLETPELYSSLDTLKSPEPPKLLVSSETPRTFRNSQNPQNSYNPFEPSDASEPLNSPESLKPQYQYPHYQYLQKNPEPSVFLSQTSQNPETTESQKPKEPPESPKNTEPPEPQQPMRRSWGLDCPLGSAFTPPFPRSLYPQNEQPSGSKGILYGSPYSPPPATAPQ